MGNFLVKCLEREKTPSADTRSQKEGVVKITVKTVKRFGADGLLDNGFEYRLVKCQRHEKMMINDCDKGDKHDGDQKAIDDDDESEEFCWECSTRLFHIPSGIMITEKNWKCYIPDGSSLFNEISYCCQEIVQKKIQDEHDFDFVTICDDGTREPLRALVSSRREHSFGMEKEKYREPSRNKSRQSDPTLIIITGKGKSRVGVLSVKQLMVGGIEKGSAIYHLVEAKKRGFTVVILDPNAWGASNGMEAINRSLKFLYESTFLALVKKDNAAPPSPPSLYILAHSAAGGYLARYLSNGEERRGNMILNSIVSLAFTDSTHNIQWLKEDVVLYQFFQSPKCLYIRNTFENPSDTFANHKNKKPGEHCEGNIWWKRRFGNIRTVWAGTTNHSLMCWTARKVIWEFFDASKRCH